MPLSEAGMSVSIMMAQEHHFPVSKLKLQRHSSCNNYQSRRNSGHSQAKNRLGPYNLTHPSAQAKALELLNLRSSDVFFDLGCSDGRILIMALQASIDREIEERRKLLLAKSSKQGMIFDILRCDERNEDCLMGECLHIKRRNKLRGNNAAAGPPLSLQYCYSAPSILSGSLDMGGHRRNLSFENCSVPHLMRNSSNDSDFDDVLDELSDDELNHAAVDPPRNSSWQTAPTPDIAQDNTSPITPLMSNRKVFKSDDSPGLSKPPLVTEDNEVTIEYDDRVGMEVNGVIEELGEWKPFHLPSDMDGDQDEDTFVREELRCVGIEFDESLVDRARTNVEKSLSKYRNNSFCTDPDSLSNRVYIRWGDILDEWVRDFNIDGTKTVDQLTLLNDATAVFVYLSPEGLKKVKPLLFEAALRRRRIQREMGESKRCDGVQQWKDLLKQQHRFQPEIVDELLEVEEALPLDTITHHKGHQSRISDITNYDFDSRTDSDLRYRANSGSFDQGKDGAVDNFVVGSPATNMQSSVSSLLTSTSTLVSPFRVVSYLHPIPGWTATRVDRSSFGSCPLFYYEDVDLQDR
ncbi:hypothetical protein HJC23_013609 [Cyclotella cryptica]|uniref:RNA methyltransferase n=1 Tax=Cyclotella cryptica TaxID=29204 RepID=A0ABD3PQI4_9STRA